LNTVNYCWCTYRTWSFQVLEGLLNLPYAKCAAILTTEDCIYDFSSFEAKGIPVIKASPKEIFDSPEFLNLSAHNRLDCLFFYGWSWLVPASVFNEILSVTLHPGKLPNDKGGSPLQNQIRNGETWSYANIIEIVEKLDSGRVFLKERFSLEGDISDVWGRMVSVGVAATRKFLKQISQKELSPQVQEIGGTIYKRVTPKQAEVDLARQSALEIYNIIRAHNETDPNTYVKQANYCGPGFKIIFSKSTLENPGLPIFELKKLNFEDFYEVSQKTNNGEACLSLQAADGQNLYVTQFRVSSV